jgi:flagella basal body P-ring formation protein FlgA
VQRATILFTTIFLLCTAPSRPTFGDEFSPDARVDSSDRVLAMVRAELSKQFPNARVDVTGGISWLRGALPAQPRSVSILATDGRGGAQFVARGSGLEAAEGQVSYSAWVSARIAMRRIHPGEKLEESAFNAQDVNIATGSAYEYRGVILARDAALAPLEARQTVLEGQFLTSTAVERVPDVRRGDTVRIQLISEGLTLSTSGTAEEPGFVDGRLRVITGRTKRELIGQLLNGNVVEVRL